MAQETRPKKLKYRSLEVMFCDFSCLILSRTVPLYLSIRSTEINTDFEMFWLRFISLSVDIPSFYCCAYRLWPCTFSKRKQMPLEQDLSDLLWMFT